MSYDLATVSEIIDEISMGPFGSNIKVECFVDEGIPVLNGSNVDTVKLREDSFRFVTREKADSLGKANAFCGDIVVTHRGTLGQIAVIPTDSKYQRYVISQSQFRMRCNLERVFPEFVVYYFHTREGQHQILSNKSQVGVPALARPTTTFQSLTLPLPSLAVQKKIIQILSCLDDKIELNNRINKNLEAQAQAIFNEWFFRKDTQNNWGVLGDIADINPSRKIVKGTVARYIEMSNLASTTAFPLGWEEKSYNGGAKFQNGDTLLARITPCLENGKGAYINFLQEGEIAFGSTEYIVITGKKGYCNEFFYFLIRYLDFQLYAAKSMTGSSGRQRVSADSIASYKMPIPSLELCEKFHEIAEQVMTSNCNRSLENRTLSKLRDTLLPKLMSGEIQIPQEV